MGLSPDTTYYFRAKMTMNGSTHMSPFSCGFKTQRADYVSPTPVITPASCTFAPYVEVNVASAVPDVVIRYTTDGSAPTSASPVWTGTLVVDDNMTISACAYRDNVKVGMMSQARYVYDTERMGQKGDAFADPIVIRGSSGSHVIGDFGPYSVEEGEIDHANGASVLTKTGWYEWTAPGTGTVTFKGKFTSESVIYSVSLAAYSGDCMDKLKQLDVYGMKSGEALGGGVSFAAKQGTTYRIVVASKSKILKDASFTLNWSGDLVVGSDPVLDPVRAPIIELPSCSFSSATNVTLACRTPGSTIRYTTDGSDPTESSQVYAQPIRLTRSVTLRARAYKSGMKPSAVVSAAYVCSAVDVPDPTPSGDGYSNYRRDDGTPQSVLLSYYDGPDTRGFAWQTSTNVTKGALWLLAGSFDASADSRFATNKVATAASVRHSDCYTHKAHLADIRPGVYSYRVGEDGRYAYGSFVVKASANPFVALNVNDMQTKEVDKISCWDRVVSAAKSVLGGPSGVDMILTGGDVIDGGTKYSDYTEWGVVVDRSRTAFPDVAWMMASGNHDTKLYDSCVDENYRYTASGNRGCHSADVGNVHLVTLPFANGLSDTVGSWLQEDLAAAKAAFRIVSIVRD